MTAFLLLVSATIFGGTSHARLAGSWGGSILFIDSDSGAIAREWAEPNMFNGYTFGPAQIDFQWGAGKSVLRASWEDVVVDPGGIRFTELDQMGVPKNKKPREIEFAFPGLSTGSLKTNGPWVDASLQPLPGKLAAAGSIGIDIREVAPAVLHLPDDMEIETIEAKDMVFVSRGGERLDALAQKTKKKLWSLNLNPKNLILAGADPQVAVIEHGRNLLVVTDRLGLRCVDRKTGVEHWSLQYSNLDVIPKIVVAGNRIILGPANK